MRQACRWTLRCTGRGMLCARCHARAEVACVVRAPEPVRRWWMWATAVCLRVVGASAAGGNRHPTRPTGSSYHSCYLSYFSSVDAAHTVGSTHDPEGGN